MNDQLKSDSEFILKWAQGEKREFTINDLPKPFKNKFQNELKFPHVRVQFALNFLVSDDYLRVDVLNHYNLETKGVKFNDWEEIETEHELDLEKKKHELEYIKKLNRDYKKNKGIVIASAILALLSAMAAIVSAYKS